MVAGDGADEAVGRVVAEVELTELAREGYRRTGLGAGVVVQHHQPRGVRGSRPARASRQGSQSEEVELKCPVHVAVDD